jgi:hypothetical protein
MASRPTSSRANGGGYTVRLTHAIPMKHKAPARPRVDKIDCDFVEFDLTTNKTLPRKSTRFVQSVYPIPQKLFDELDSYRSTFRTTYGESMYVCGPVYASTTGRSPDFQCLVSGKQFISEDLNDSIQREFCEEIGVGFTDSPVHVGIDTYKGKRSAYGYIHAGNAIVSGTDPHFVDGTDNFRQRLNYALVGTRDDLIRLFRAGQTLKLSENPEGGIIGVAIVRFSDVRRIVN